jgi:hypothetical protein
MIHFGSIIYLHIFIPELTNFGNLLLYYVTTLGTYVVLFPHVISLFFEWLGYLGCQMNDFTSLVWMQNGRRKEILTGFSQVCYCNMDPSFCCKNFYMIFVYYSLMFMSIFHSTIQSVSCQSDKMLTPRHCRKFNHTVRFTHCLFCFLTSLAIWLHGKKSQNET